MFDLMMPMLANPFKGLMDDLLRCSVTAGQRVCKGLWLVLSRSCLLCTGSLLLSLCALFLYFLLLSLLMPIVHQSAEVQLHSVGSCKQGELDVGAGVVFQRESYRLKLVLDLPESDANFAVGNFDVKVAFSGNITAQGTVSPRQGIMKYRSPMIRLAREMLFLGLFVLGIWDQSQQVAVQLRTPLLESVEKAVVQVCPKELQVYSAAIHVEPELSGLRGFVAAHPVLAGFLGVSLLFLLEVVVLLRYYLKHQSTHSLIESLPSPSLPVPKPILSLQPLQEVEPVASVPSDFSHLLLPEDHDNDQSWLITFRRNCKRKVA